MQILGTWTLRVSKSWASNLAKIDARQPLACRHSAKQMVGTRSRKLGRSLILKSRALVLGADIRTWNYGEPVFCIGGVAC